MSVVVPSNSSVNDVSDLTSVQAPTDADGRNINELLSHIKLEKGVDLATEKVDSYQAAYENLVNGSSQAMVFNSAYSSLLGMSYENYRSNLKTSILIRLRQASKTKLKHMIQMSLTFTSVVLIPMVQFQRFHVQMST